MTTTTHEVALRGPTRTHRTFTPRIDLLTSDEALLLVADLPGVSRDKLGLEVDRGVLQLTAFRSQSVRYHRALRLPDDVDVDGIEASLKHGVLTLRLPRRQATQSRRIAISEG